MGNRQSHVTFYPYIDVDYIKISQDVYRDMEAALEHRKKMEGDTLLLTDFESLGIPAQYFSPESLIEATTFTIYKKIPGQTYYTYLCTLGGDENSECKFLDYNIASNQFYNYLVYIESTHSTSAGEERIFQTYTMTNDDGKETYFHTKLNSWILCNIEESDNGEYYIKTGDVWELGMNLEAGELTQNMNITTWDTLGKYPKVSKGVRNYKTMSFTGLLGSMQEYKEYTFDQIDTKEGKTPTTVYKYTEKMLAYDPSQSDLAETEEDERWGIWDPYAREIEKLEAWEEFVDDGSLKLLRDPKGRVWIIQITGSTTSNINYQSSSQQTTVSFQWAEVENAAEAVVLKLGDPTED